MVEGARAELRCNAKRGRKYLSVAVVHARE